LRSRAKASLNLLRTLERQEELAKIKVPDVPEGGALVHGRVVDGSGRGVEGLIVCGEDQQGKRNSVLGKAETGAAGYFAFPLDSKSLGSLASAEIFLTVVTSRGEVVSRDAVPFEIEASTRMFRSIVLGEESPPPGKKAASQAKRRERPKAAKVEQRREAGKAQAAKAPPDPKKPGG
jgi:hypothetical protein